MFAVRTVPKRSWYGDIVMTILTYFIIFAMLANSYWGEISYQEPEVSSQNTVPLLLNSGVVQTEEAEVSIILWFENGDIPHATWTRLPVPDWKWTYNELQSGGQKAPVTLSGHQRIDKKEESSLYQWYTTMQIELAKTGGLIYIDERVDQATDISAYLSKTNALPNQWVLVGNLVSIAAYQDDLLSSVYAGKDRINIQLLTRGKNTEGRTVLAIPALLKEF